MTKFPIDAPKRKVIKALDLDFVLFERKSTFLWCERTRMVPNFDYACS